MSRLKLFPAAVLLACVVPSLAVADALTEHTVKQPTNWTAIGMFVVFVILTLAITKWAADRARFAFAILFSRGRHHRPAKRSCHRRRFHVGGVIPRDFRSRLSLRL